MTSLYLAVVNFRVSLETSSLVSLNRAIHLKVRKRAKIKNRYNEAPHLAQVLYQAYSILNSRSRAPRNYGACTDPGIFVRCVCVGGGRGCGEGRGGGESRSNGQKTSDLVVTCVFLLFFKSSNYSEVYFKEKL